MFLLGMISKSIFSICDLSEIILNIYALNV